MSLPRRSTASACRGTAVTWLVSSDVPVRRRDVPFDVDVGPDGSGAVTLVYSRCRREPPQRGDMQVFPLPQYQYGKRCRIYRTAPAGGRERRIRLRLGKRWSVYQPSVWGERIVFAMSRPGERPRLGTSSIDGGRVTRLRGGTGRHGAGPIGLDLRGDRVAFAWAGAVERCTPTERPLPDGSARIRRGLWIEDLTTRRRSLIDGACEGNPATRLTSPSWLNTESVTYVAGFAQDVKEGSYLRRFNVTTGAYEESGPVDGLLYSFAAESGLGVAAVQQPSGLFLMEIGHYDLAFSPSSRLRPLPYTMRGPARVDGG